MMYFFRVARHEYGRQFIPACTNEGVSGWAKLGQDTTPFNDYLKNT